MGSAGRPATVLVLLAAVLLAIAPAPASAEDTQTYIVVLKPGPASQLPIAAAEAASRGRGTIEATYSNALRGFAITMPRSSPPQIADQPDVAYIEPDQALGLQSQRVPTGVGRTFGKANATIGIDGADDRRVDVDVAVIDTGIDASHPDPLAAGQARQLPVAGRGGVPADAAAVALTVTATRPARAGNITAHPAGTGRPLASNLNYQPGQTVANTVIVPIGTDGSITLATSATTHLIADINGYFVDPYGARQDTSP